MITRDQFRERVFERDNHTCVVPGCNAPAVDAHHILERHLWLADDPYPEGYHLANGASVCELHHRACESNAIPPQALRRWLNLETVLPQQLDPNKIWNKWGEEIKSSLHFHAKYPGTPYFPFSETVDLDDDLIDIQCLLNKPLMFTIKMDGSNVVLTKDRVAARNGLEANHESFDYLKALHGGFKALIPDGIQLFGEWLYAKHSIHYIDNLALPDYLQIFAVYEQKTQLFWSYDEAVQFCASRGFAFVPVIGKATFEKEWALIDYVSRLAQSYIKLGQEGLVAKSAYPYHYGQHSQNVAKVVRPNHVQTSTHWKKQRVVKNELTRRQ